jgi:Domain of unknown function (DUF3846)
MSSSLYRTDGTIVPVAPANGVHWTLPELQGLVGGYIEHCCTLDGRIMIVNELGKIVTPMLPLNKEATRIYMHGRVDPIVGPAVVVDSLSELKEPGEDDDEEDLDGDDADKA